MFTKRTVLAVGLIILFGLGGAFFEHTLQFKLPVFFGVWGFVVGFAVGVLFQKEFNH